MGPVRSISTNSSHAFRSLLIKFKSRCLQKSLVFSIRLLQTFSGLSLIFDYSAYLSFRQFMIWSFGVNRRVGSRHM